MTGRVIDLDSRRPKPLERHCGCQPGRQCYPHRLDTLAARLRAHLDDQEGELLVTLKTHETVVAGVLEVLDGITNECLSADRRTVQ